MQVRITRDQAVWERESFWLEAPEGLDEDALRDWAEEQLDRHDSGDQWLEPTIQIRDSVEGHDTHVEVYPA